MESRVITTDKGIIIFKVLIQWKFWEEDSKYWQCCWLMENRLSQRSSSIRTALKYYYHSNTEVWKGALPSSLSATTCWKYKRYSYARRGISCGTSTNRIIPWWAVDLSSVLERDRTISVHRYVQNVCEPHETLYRRIKRLDLGHGLECVKLRRHSPIRLHGMTLRHKAN
jgi:hypothetical protein